MRCWRRRELVDQQCQECGLQFAVYGVFATCPDCTRMNAQAVFRKSMEAARRRPSLLDGDVDSEMIEGLLSDALGAAVGAFDAIGRSCAVGSQASCPPPHGTSFRTSRHCRRRWGRQREGCASLTGSLGGRAPWKLITRSRTTASASGGAVMVSESSSSSEPIDRSKKGQQVVWASTIAVSSSRTLVVFRNVSSAPSDRSFTLNRPAAPSFRTASRRCRWLSVLRACDRCLGVRRVLPGVRLYVRT
jgi:hypothetical protein